MDNEAVSANLKKARQCWGRIGRLLSRDGASPRTMARFYLAIIQAMLLYGCSMWVLTKRALCRLEAFHARCARHIVHMHIRRLPSGEWITPPTHDVLDCCGLSPITTYIAKRKTSLLHYAKDYSPAYQASLRSVPVASTPHHLVWWT